MAVEALRLGAPSDYGRDYRVEVGTATIAVDPDHRANGAVVDLDRARRDPDGLVRFETDVVLLRAPRPGPLLQVVANRGMVTSLPFSAGVTARAEATGDIATGDGWVLDRGISVLWVGWQWDVDRRPGAVGIAAPDAVGDDGLPIPGQARLYFQPVVTVPRRRLADVVLPFMGQFRPLPVRRLDDPSAVLTERAWFNGPARAVERDRWRFVDHEHVELDGGFEARTHYELTYETSACPVAGAGIAAVRDVVSHLRREFTDTLAFGASQSGRWLREFLLAAANADEDGNRVFDGIHCHIAGARRGEFNHRYAQPSLMNALGFTHLPPFSADDLLEGARAAGTAPKVVFTNTATEYWRGDASLVHPSATEGDDWRAYLYAGANHSGQMPGYVESLPVQLAPNLVDIQWSTRAHFDALCRWVAGAELPPPSAVPRVADGTGVSREDALAAWPAHEGVSPPAPEALLGMPDLDLGPRADRGVGSLPPAVVGPSRPCLVSALDGDGNEVAGVRLPHVAVPIDVSSGWNPERPRPGVPVEVWNLVGGRVDLTPDEVVRRHGGRDAFLAEVQECAARLVDARHLLSDDVDHVVTDAAARWDRLLGPGD